jgi:LPS export ABC transporter permease LptG
VKKLSQYIFLETLRPSLLGLLFYTFVMVMNQLFEIVRQAFQRGAGFSIVLQLLVLALPKILVLTVPMSLLLGVLVGLGRLSADSEVVALRAAGVSYWRMARPVLLLGFLAFLLGTLDYHVLVPWTNKQVGNVRVSMLRKTDPNREIRAGVFYDEIPDTLVYAEEVVRGDRTWPLRRVIVATSRVDASITSDASSAPAPDVNDAASDADVAPPPDRTVVCGERGRIELAPDASKITFIIEKGEIHIENPKDPTGYQRVRQRQFTTTLTLGGSDNFSDARKLQASDLTTPQLLEEIRVMESAPNWQKSPARMLRWRQAMSELNWRFSVPFAAMAFCFLAFPLGLINHRGGKTSGFALSLAVIIFYWLALRAGKQLAIEGKLPVTVATWAPDVIVVVAGLALLLLRQKRDVFSLASGSRARVRAWQTRIAAGLMHRRKTVPAAEPDLAVFTTTPATRSRLAVVDRYIVRRFVGFFLLVLLSASALYQIVEAQSLMEAISEHNQPMSLALKYLAYFTPGMLKVITPIACLVAVMITLGTMARANEDTALKAAGISIFRISAPLIIATAGLSLMYFLVQDYVAPYTNRKASFVRDEIEGRVSSATVAGTRWVFGKDSRLYAYGDYNTATKTLQGVSAIQLAHDPFRIRRRIQAPRVQWSSRGWIAARGWEREFRGDEEPYRTLKATVLSWPELPDDFARQERSLLSSERLAEEMSFFSLWSHVRKMQNSGYDTTRLSVSLYEKLAFPAAPLVMVLIGLPFAFRSGRRGSLYGLGIALGLVIVYWSLFAVSSALGEQALLPPFLAAWSPNLMFALAGGYLFLSTRS